jgi:sugar phosphate permease
VVVEHPADAAVARDRARVLVLLCLLMVITYLDRVCISVAGPRMQEALGISPLSWGWVTGVFTLAYAVFEIPSGVLGDRIGPRRVLTRIVLWWSAFTSLTGMVTGFYPLLATRFLFGMGEAGAFPNASVAVSRWFPAHERGRAFGLSLMSSQLGGAIAPLLVIPIQVRYGWRAAFYVFGLLGVIWSAVWYWWFRDSPDEKRGGGRVAETVHPDGSAGRHALPWAVALRSRSLWAAMGVACCYVYPFYFFQSWFHTYLVRARGYSERDLVLSSLPFVVGAIANCAGGFASTALMKRRGLTWARHSIGASGLAIAALSIAGALITPHWLGALILLSLAYGGITFQQPSMFAVCLDIGGRHAGGVVGAMNTAAQVGAFASSLMFGYLVDRTGSYDAPFVPMIVLLVIGACLWLWIDPTRPVVEADVRRVMPGRRSPGSP